jgi:hypothetical protein
MNFTYRLIQTTVATLGLVCLSSSANAGAGCSVPGDYPTIQGAVNDVACDTILLSPQTYAEEIVISRGLTLSGNGATLSGNGSFRPLTVDGRSPGTTTVSLHDLSLSTGLASSSSIGARSGGCLLVIGDADGEADVTAWNLTVTDCIASDSALSGFGGGIAVRDNATLDLSTSMVTSNFASKRSASFTGSGAGGGLWARGDTASGAGQLLMSSSTIQGNVASARMGVNGFAVGGGLRVQEQASAILSHNTWRDNVARQDGSDPGAAGFDLAAEGGAIAVTAASLTATLTATGDRFFDNTADTSNADLGSSEVPRGGAVSLHATNTAGQVIGLLQGVVMTGNQAKGGSGTGEGRGGAIHARGATLIVERGTLVGNRADNATITTDDGYGGGIYFREPDTDPSNDFLEVTNTIIAGNDSCNGIAPNCIGDGAQAFVDFSGIAQHVATFVHTTLADDSLNPKPALHFFGPTAGDELIVHDSIIANHAIGIQNTNATGWSRGLYNLFDGNTVNRLGVAFGDEATWVNGSADFVDAAGGDYHIGAASDAIDLGRNVNAGSYSYGIIEDVDDQPRVAGMMGDVDTGADELGNPKIFSDGFESGGVVGWSGAVGGP